MESDWSVSALDGRDDVTLVTVDLRNPSPVDRRIRVSNRLDGRVLPPRRGGVPESGWDEDGFTGVVPADSRRVLGYACSAPACRPPVSVTDEGRADGDGAETTATDAVRELGDAQPPSDAVPRIGENEEPTDSEGPPTETEPRPADAPPELPAAVDAWLASVTDRIERGERLTDASVEATTAALETEDDITDLEANLAADARALAAVERRVTALSERAAAVDVPADALRRLS